MAAVVSALDTHTPLQQGENLHAEHGWSHDAKEKTLQLTFQLTRTSDAVRMKKLGETYRDLVLLAYENQGDQDDLLDTLYKVMLHTRDIVQGKGEYALFYELLSRWAGMSYYSRVSSGKTSLAANHGENNFRTVAAALTRRAIASLVKLEGHDHGYGSWKDMKYFLNKLKERFPDDYVHIDAYHFVIHLMKSQLQMDESTGDRPSLLGRWAPRETSKPFGWIARPISEALYSDWMKSATTSAQKRAASLKCRIHYRQLIARLSATLNTPQVNMCAGKWDDIDFDKDVTSITMSRSKRAFEYVDKQGTSRGTDEVRMTCRKNYKDYIERCKSGKTEIKAARVSLVDMVKEAVALSRQGARSAIETQVDAVNEQWKASGKQVNSLGNFVCMVDTSGSMECDNGNPLYAAIGLGLRACEKSALGKRVMTFSARPRWLNLEDKPEFVDKVAFLKNDSTWGNNTNFQAALQLVADACVEKAVPPSQVKDLVLAVFSDMQIDAADRSARTMDEQVRKTFHDAGMRSKFNHPYEPPHMLFWNLRSTDGFPSLSSEKNISMMSGFSPALLNSFQDKGMEALEDFTPWCMLIDQLQHERYAWTKDAVTAACRLHRLAPVSELPNVHEPPEIIDIEGAPAEESSGWFGLW